MNSCIVYSPGHVPYAEAWDLQKWLHQQVVEGDLPNALLLLEHPHVYTLGRRGKQQDILIPQEKLDQIGAEVHAIDRGGEVTYHGPGQLVGYPIINLRKWGVGPLKYVQTLERMLIATLAEFGIQSEGEERPTGVWVGDAKIAAIGVRVSRGATMHGFALNVNPDLSYFDHIVPCGMPDASVTSIERELSSDIRVSEVLPVLVRHFGEVFQLDMKSSEVDVASSSVKL